MSTNKHELSTALSYYNIFRIKTNSGNTNIADLLGLGTGSERSRNAQNQSYNFWDEDAWTEKDRLAAERKLEQSKSECELAGEKRLYEIGKLEFLAARKWDIFYQRNTTNFFKNRHYLHKAFPHDFYFLENDGSTEPVQEVTLFEIGCGVGNNILPLLKHQNLRMRCFDFSKVAIQFLHQNPIFKEAAQQGHATAQVWDITTCENTIPTSAADITMLFFCLSAITPDKMPQAARNVASTLRPGGILLFRDYGRYDEAQMKLGTSKNKLLGQNFYVKHDGTRCYYFDLQDVCEIFGEDGADLKILELKYIHRVYTNRATGLTRRRVWVQGRFQKI